MGGVLNKSPQSEINVDLNRYSGKWFQVAHTKNGFQDRPTRIGGQEFSACVAGTTTATYEINKDGSVKVTNECQRTGIDCDDCSTVEPAFGSAVPVKVNEDGTISQRLIVAFGPSWTWPIQRLFSPRGNYWIVGLDEKAYKWVVVTSPSRRLVWVLARRKTLTRSQKKSVQDVLDREGVNTNNFLEEW